MSLLLPYILNLDNDMNHHLPYLMKMMMKYYFVLLKNAKDKHKQKAVINYIPLTKHAY